MAADAVYRFFFSSRKSALVLNIEVFFIIEGANSYSASSFHVSGDKGCSDFIAAKPFLKLA